MEKRDVSETSTPEVVLVVSNSGDWEALYRGGTRIAENHTLYACDVLTALGIPYRIVHVDMPLEAKSLPDQLADAVKMDPYAVLHSTGKESGLFEL